MPGFAKSREFKLQAIQELEAIANAHLQWLGRYHRVLICGEPPGADVTADDAHCQCAFGTWYGRLDLAEYAPWAALLRQVDAAHRQMHATAASLVDVLARSAIAAEDYGRFADQAYRFKTGIRSLQMKLIRDACLVDHLTGVWNRSSLLQRLSEEYDRMLRHGDSCCLCMMDLDHFKSVNDRYGHAVGDQILQGVAGVARRRLRRYDAVFRYGGEEFLFCLPRTSLAEAVASMERIREDIAGSTFGLDAGGIRITASFGVAVLSPAVAIDKSIEAADQALFAAKAAGRNRISCA